MKFVIHAPSYTHIHAGVVALHRLCHLLNDAGYYAEIFADGVNEGWKTPRFTGIKDAIVIYPEIEHGNPLKAKRVVRWLLNVPQTFGVGDKEFPGEMVWAYHKGFAAGLTERILTVPVINPQIFYKGKGPRDINCYYIGKAKGLPRPIDDAIYITRQWPKTQLELADLLRRCKTLYTYDDKTSLIPEALICGAKVVCLDGEMAEINIKNYKKDYDDTAPIIKFAEEVKGYFHCE